MDTEFALELCSLNNRFYAQQAESFSATRHSSWPGWEKCLEASKPAFGSLPLNVLDLACGNFRFEEFLAQNSNAAFSALALDACSALPVERADTRFAECDLIAELSAGTLTQRLANESAVDANLAVCFGFMHHIPLPAWRIQLVAAMVGSLQPGGCACISFWQFMSDEGLASRARETHERGCAELGLAPEQFNQGDYLLGWKNTPGAYRYCHSFTNEEISELVAALPQNARTAARFKADGRTGNLNEYLVLQKL